jgi:hypothetical protein
MSLPSSINRQLRGEDVDIPACISDIDPSVKIPISLDAADVTGEIPVSIDAANVTGIIPVTIQGADPGTDVHTIIHGITTGGVTQDVGVSGTRELLISVHHPVTSYGEVSTASNWAAIQTDATYGINDGQIRTDSGVGGSVTSTNSTFVVDCGNSAGGRAILQSRDRIRYRAGQGSLARLGAAFSAAVPATAQIAGVGHAEDGVFFGYLQIAGTFGIVYNRFGVRGVVTLTVTVGSSTAENATVELEGINFSVPVTNSGSVQRTVYELSQFVYDGWIAEPVNDTVVFLRTSAEPLGTPFSLTATTAVGAFVVTKPGVLSTRTEIPQASWNGEPCDGTGPTGFTLDPTIMNVYQIQFQYLGGNAISCAIETTSLTEEPTMTRVHTIGVNSQIPAFSLPSFQLTASSFNIAGSSAPVTIGSFSAFHEGTRRITGNNVSYNNTIAGVDSTLYHAVLTIRNMLTTGGKTNQGILHIQSLSAAVAHNKPVEIFVFRSVGNEDFLDLQGDVDFEPTNSTSMASVDTSASTLLVSRPTQLVWSGSLGGTGNLEHKFNYFDEDFNVEPGESVSICARASSGTGADVLCSIVTNEDR